MDKLLSRTPTDVADFCEIKKYIMEAEDELEVLGEKYNKIGELEMIMQENNIKMPDKNNSAIKEVSFVKNSCREKLSMGRDTIEAVQPMYVKKLEKKVPELERKVKELQEELDVEELKKSTTPIEEAVELIRTLGIKMEKLKEEGREINDQQKFLEVQQMANFECIEDTYFDFNLKQRLWKGVDDWNVKLKTWKETIFCEINRDQIQEQVDQFDKMSAQCQLNLEKNDMAAIFRSSVEEMLGTMPVVSYLRDPALEQEH